MHHTSRSPGETVPTHAPRLVRVDALTRVGALVLIVLALAVVARADMGASHAARAAIRLWTTDNAAGGHALDNRFSAVRQQLRDQIPPGASIYMAGNPDPNWLWYQRFLEFAAIEGMPVVDDLAHADYTVTLVADAGAPGGLRITARRTS